jgi:hypothetical protein
VNEPSASLILLITAHPFHSRDGRRTTDHRTLIRCR